MPVSVATQEDYRIELIDDSLTTVALLDMAHGLCYSMGLFGYGRVGGIALHIDSLPAQMIYNGDGDWFIRIYRKGVYMRTFKIEKDDYGYAANLDKDDDYLALTLQPAEWIFKDAFGQPDLVGGLPLASPNVPYDDAVLWIVDHACGPNAYPSLAAAGRTINGMTVAAAASAHPTSGIVITANRQNMWEWLNFFCPTFDIDFSLDLVKTAGDANEWVFSVYYPRRGTDRTEGGASPTLINDASLNIISGRRFREREFSNVVVSAALDAEAIDAASVATHGRKEMLAKTNDGIDLASLLEEYGLHVGYEYEFSETDNCQLVTHLNAGDLVTTNNFRMAEPVTDQLIQEIFVTLTKEFDEQLEFVFGAYDKPLDQNDGGGGWALPMDTFWSSVVMPVANVPEIGTLLAVPYGDHEHDLNIMADKAGVMLLTAGVGHIVGTNGIDTLIDGAGQLVVNGTGATSGWYIQGNASTDVSPDVGNSIRLYGANGYTVTEDVPNNQLLIGGPWYRDVVGVPFLRQTTIGDELRIKHADTTDMFYVDANGNIGGYVTGTHLLQALFADYSFGDYAGGIVGVHSINMAGDLASDASGIGIGSALYWTNINDKAYFKDIYTIDAFTPGATGWHVDENGNTLWKVAAELTLESVIYRFPLAGPAVGDSLGVNAVGPPNQMVWQAGIYGTPGTLTAITGNVGGDGHTHSVTGFAVETLTLTAGNGMTGGGDLTANRTFNVGPGTGITVDVNNVNIADTAVAPAAYGDATHVGTFTVDQQGRLTAAADVAITGIVPSAHDIVGALHTVAGAIYQVVGLTAANTIGLLTPTVVSAANSLVRTNASGYIRATRLEVGGATEYISLPFAGQIGVLGGTYVRLSGAGTVVLLGAATFRPDVTATVDLGSLTKYWNDGFFKGDIYIDAAGKGIIASDNTAGYVLAGDATRYVPTDPSTLGLWGGYWKRAGIVIDPTTAGDDVHVGANITMDNSTGYVRATRFEVGSAAEYINVPFAGQIGILGGTLVRLNGAGTVAILAAATFRPDASSTVDLGLVAKKWKDGYFSGTVYTVAVNIAAYGVKTGPYAPGSNSSVVNQVGFGLGAQLYYDSVTGLVGTAAGANKVAMYAKSGTHDHPLT